MMIQADFVCSSTVALYHIYASSVVPAVRRFMPEVSMPAEIDVYEIDAT